MIDSDFGSAPTTARPLGLTEPCPMTLAATTRTDTLPSSPRRRGRKEGRPGRPSCATCGSRLRLRLGLRALLAVRPHRRRRRLALLLLALAAADAGGHLLGLHHLERHLGLLALRRAAHEDGAAGRQLRAQDEVRQR